MRTRDTVLFIVHSWGGGTIRFASELASLIADRVDVVFAWGLENKSFHISRRGPHQADQSFLLSEGLDAPLSALSAANIVRVNVIQTMGLEQHVAALLERLEVPYDVTFTDYHHFSAAPHFEDENGRFVGDAAVADIAKAASRNISPLLRNADRRIAISRDLAYRLQMFLPELPIIPVRVLERSDAAGIAVQTIPLGEEEPMRILALGRPQAVKGLSSIIAIAKRAEAENFPIEIISLGDVTPEASGILSALPRVRVLGQFEQNELASLVARLKPHLAWLPFNTPETHSYALSDAMHLGLPILVSEIGAVAERVSGRKSTWAIPFDETGPDNFYSWLKKLHSERLQTPSQCSSIDHLPQTVKSFYPNEYLRPLRRSLLSRLIGRLSGHSPGGTSRGLARK
jgi:glycosyltransferase involved in cell wall biosynthesis